MEMFFSAEPLSFLTWKRSKVLGWHEATKMFIFGSLGSSLIADYVWLWRRKCNHVCEEGRDGGLNKWSLCTHSSSDAEKSQTATRRAKADCIVLWKSEGYYVLLVLSCFKSLVILGGISVVCSFPPAASGRIFTSVHPSKGGKRKFAVGGWWENGFLIILVPDFHAYLLHCSTAH